MYRSCFWTYREISEVDRLRKLTNSFDMNRFPFPALALLVFFACEEPASEVDVQIHPISEVECQQLNPARGDKSPRAGTLWGDRSASGPTGFLLYPVDGFESPPHIHNVSYRGVVIRGLIHNDDPDAEKMWMPSGSFWTQPGGESHITAAKGTDSLAYIEVDDGPFLVRPASDAFDNGERPVNVDVSNIVWLDASNSTWVDPSGNPDPKNAPRLAFLWGEPRDRQFNGTLLKLPAGYSGKIRSHGSTIRAVVIQGPIELKVPGQSGWTTLDPGSYFTSPGNPVHPLFLKSKAESSLYIRTQGRYNVSP